MLFIVLHLHPQTNLFIMTESTNQYKFDSIDIILYFWKRRVPIIVITMVAAIVSIVVSLLIEEKYKSEVILFPSASGSISQDLLSVGVTAKAVLRLGEDEELEQLMQVLQSNEIRNRVIRKFNLREHYGISPDTRYPQTTLQRKYDKNITIAPTKFLSVRITVLDKDPQMAADIANEISNLVDTVMNNMQREKALQALALVEDAYNSLKSEIAELQDSLNHMRLQGVVDYKTQVESLNNAMAKALAKGDTKTADKIQAKLNDLSRIGGTSTQITAYLTKINTQLIDLRAKYSEAQLDAKQKLSHKYVVNAAVKAEKKSYPIRWLIVTMSTASAFVLSLLLLVVFDSIAANAARLKTKKE